MDITAKRIESDIHLKLTLKDGDVRIAWDTTDVKQVCMYSVEQRAFAGHCSFEVDGDDNTILNVLYPASKQLYLGDHRVVVRVIIAGDEATYDALAFTLKPTSDDDGSISTETVEVGIEVEEVDSTVLHEILAACQAATDDAEEAAQGVEEEVQRAVDAAEVAVHAAEAAEAAANGKYTKPADGIPASDMTAAVQESLGKADSALQPSAVVGRVTINCDEEGDLGIIDATIDWAAVAAKCMYAVVVEWDESVANYYNDGNYIFPSVLSLSDGTDDNDVPVLNFRGKVYFDTYVYEPEYILTLTADAVNTECTASFDMTIERKMEEALAGKADSSDVYTKSQTDTLLAGKVGSTDVTSIVKVAALPADPDDHTLYIIVE